MRHLLITLGAVAAWFLPWHLALLAVLLYVWASAMTSTTNTAKTRALAAQHAALVAAVTTTNLNLGTTNTNLGTTNTNVTTQTNRVNNLSGNSTSTNSLSDNQVSGVSDNPAPTGSPIVLTSGVQNATVGGSTVAQHSHSYGHQHGRGSYAVGNGNHNHSLPNV